MKDEIKNPATRLTGRDGLRAVPFFSSVRDDKHLPIRDLHKEPGIGAVGA